LLSHEVAVTMRICVKWGWPANIHQRASDDSQRANEGWITEGLEEERLVKAACQVILGAGNWPTSVHVHQMSSQQLQHRYDRLF
jgi:hypothetical protein